MARIDNYYQNLLDAIVKTGYWYKDESRDVRCKQISSVTLSLPVHDGELPILTTKKMYLKGVVGELLWFLRGEDNIKPLIDLKVGIWNKDAYNWYVKRFKIFNPNSLQNLFTLQEFILRISEAENIEELKDFQGLGKGYCLGDVGRNYGVQWRDWTSLGKETNEGLFYLDSLDQISNTIENLIKRPMGRRHIVTAWNPAELADTALPPCHWAFEFLPRPLNDEDKLLSPSCEYGLELKWHQRSVDTFLGLPFNIASYYLKLEFFSAITNMKPLGIIGDLSNVHIYEPHLMSVQEQLSKNPNKYSSAKFKFSDRAKKLFENYRLNTLSFDNLIHNLEIEDFEFEYESFPAIKAEMLAPNK